MAKGEFIWIDQPSVVLVQAVDVATERIRNELIALMNRYAAEIETWMKANGKWTDRTGNMRQSLFARMNEELFEVAILMGYGVTYGDFLEYGFQGRFSIVTPALDYFWDRLWTDVRALVQ